MCLEKWTELMKIDRNYFQNNENYPKISQFQSKINQNSRKTKFKDSLTVKSFHLRQKSSSGSRSVSEFPSELDIFVSIFSSAHFNFAHRSSNKNRLCDWACAAVAFKNCWVPIPPMTAVLHSSTTMTKWPIGGKRAKIQILYFVKFTLHIDFLGWFDVENVGINFFLIF